MAFHFPLLLIFVALFSTAHGFSIQEATGVIPVTPRQDTTGSIGRTVSDAVSFFDTVVGFHHNEFEATGEASKYIPYGGYAQFLKIDGLKGKRLGIVPNPLFTFANESALSQAFEQHFQTLRKEGAILVDQLEIANIQTILNFTASGEAITSIAEFKLWLNAYLKDLGIYPVHSLADSVRFNPGFSDIEMRKKIEEDIFLVGQAPNGNGELEKAAVLNMARLRDGFVKLMMENQLDALVTACPGAISQTISQI